ncbi:MAG: sugar porter family MFS transporter [Scytolyngbya sp. HA4215-MV1]|jgi:sugar porter (SP) family MFS transporter|nr:sugar porter family MFS transporter [Scytolyngbya sp. HA4215-MV1]
MSTTIRKAGTYYVILISGAAALGGFLFGFDTAVVNGAVVALTKAFNASSWLTGLAVSLALLGSAVGAFCAGQIADRYGRVKAMVVASGLFTISAIGSGFSASIWDFTFWRLLGGIAVGIASVIAPAYIAECSPAQMRGRLGSLQQMAIVLGIFIALLSDYFIAVSAGSAERPFLFGITAWRWMFLTAAFPAVLYGMAVLTIPESPRYLVAQGREQEASTVLAKILDGNILAKIEEIRQTVFQERKPNFSDLLRKNGGLLPIVWIGVSLSLLQQFVGINVIFYYSSVLWRAVGFSEQDSLKLTVITGAVNIITTLIAIIFVDRFGRKPLLLIGSIGMTVTLGILTTIFSNAAMDAAGNPQLVGSAGILALLAANLYVFCFGFSWGPVVWVLLGEMFNNKIRTLALSIAAAAQWVANFVVSTTFPPLLQYLGLGTTYGLYTLSAAISIFFVAFFIQETRGIELEKM